MRFLLAFALLVTIIVISQPTPVLSENSVNGLAGRWRVKVSLAGIPEKNLIFEAKAGGTGTLLGLDTGVENKAMPDAAPAVWSELTNGRLSFSGNIELPLGTCCREVGTLIFKGTVASDQVIKGRAIFIASTVDEENFNGFTSATGSFSAIRESK